jgi:DNA polymerase-1
MTEDASWRPPDTLPYTDDRWKVFTFDLETDGTDVYGNSRAVGAALKFEDGRKVYLPWGHKGGGNLDRGKVISYLNKTLKGKTVRMTEAKFDIAMSRKEGVDLEALGCRVEELQFRFGLLDEYRRSFKLEDLSQEFLGYGKLPMDHARIAEYHSSHIGPYAEQDVDNTDLLFQFADPKIDEQGLRTVATLEDDIIYAVLEMERNGVRLHRQMLQEWIKSIDKEFTSIVRFVNDETGLNINPNSSPDLARLFKVLHLDYGHTEKGAASFTDVFLKTVDHPWVQKIRRARAIDSLKSKNLKKYLALLTPDDRMRFKLHQLKGDEYGTVSGRFSSSSPNIQQVFDPERQAEKMGSELADYIIRELFIPSDGMFWLKADASQIEFRLMAHYSNSAKLLKAYRDNPDIDFHVIVQEILKSKVKNMSRKKAKNTNFGMVYAMGREKMARQLGVSQEEADELYNAYNAEFPEVKGLIKKAMARADNPLDPTIKGNKKARGYVRTILGRRARYFYTDLASGEQRAADKGLHSAFNRVNQGSAADILKLKLRDLYNERKNLGVDKLLCTVHDEFDMEVDSPDRRGPIKAFLDQDLGLGIRVPLTWDVEVTRDWAGNYKGRKVRSTTH